MSPKVGVNPPTEPEGYDPQNKYKDPVKYFQHREAVVAKEFVDIAEAKVTAQTLFTLTHCPPSLSRSERSLLWPQLLRKQLQTCYKEAGVNFVTDCKEVSVRRWSALLCFVLPL
jgi:hypothetical protein